MDNNLLLKITDIHTFIGQFHILQGVSVEVPKGKIVIYLSTVNKNGDAIYMKQDKSVAVLKKDGTVLRNDKPVNGCTKHVFAK